MLPTCFKSYMLLNTIILPLAYMRSNLLTCKDFFFSEENDFFRNISVQCVSWIKQVSIVINFLYM